MRKANILPIALMAFAVVAFLFMVDYSINGGKWPWSIHNTNQTVDSNTNSSSPVITNVAYPSTVKLFSSPDLGIQFYYNTAGPEASGVKQIGDTVYVYPDTYTDPTNGQYVQVFSKEATDTLAQAITKRFLSGISMKDCFITSLAYGDVDISASQSAAIIDWPSTLIDDNHPFGDNSKCPKQYQKTNGVNYFLTDSQNPTKLLFFSIGQYAITVDNVHTWQSTLRFTSATADWKTYTNTVGKYSIQYPPTWKAAASTIDNEVVNLIAPDAAAKTQIELGPYFSVSPETKIDTSDCINASVQANESKIVVNGQTVTRTKNGCLATVVNTYFPQPKPLTGYFRISWPEVFQKDYQEYEEMLATFTFIE